MLKSSNFSTRTDIILSPAHIPSAGSCILRHAHTASLPVLLSLPGQSNPLAICLSLPTVLNSPSHSLVTSIWHTGTGLYWEFLCGIWHPKVPREEAGIEIVWGMQSFCRRDMVSAPSLHMKNTFFCLLLYLLSPQTKGNMDCIAKSVNWFHLILNKVLLFYKSIISPWSCL